MRLTEGDQPCADDEVSDVATCEKRFCVCAEGSSMFWKRLNARSATELLSTEPAGTYLLRRSEHPKFEYTLSQKLSSSGVVHVRIRRDADGSYNLDSDSKCPSSKIHGFTCVVNLIEAWSRAYCDFGLKGLRRAALRHRGDLTSYVNVETENVCFHDDQEAEQSVRRFVANFVKKQAAKKHSG